ncbi:hypothetical protein CDAR_92541 [Caerostris darwini]|uniref:Uncharacterized protein n=1 Tax=Caerostris darwini TaxID=1538125 RepID=A0AAV4PFV3_9ARAC|nr:hypothetical protein CDAR_92541 [Caerostris darwini]
MEEAKLTAEMARLRTIYIADGVSALELYLDGYSPAFWAKFGPMPRERLRERCFHIFVRQRCPLAAGGAPRHDGADRPLVRPGLPEAAGGPIHRPGPRAAAQDAGVPGRRPHLRVPPGALPAAAARPGLAPTTRRSSEWNLFVSAAEPCSPGTAPDVDGPSTSSDAGQDGNAASGSGDTSHSLAASLAKQNLQD